MAQSFNYSDSNLDIEGGHVPLNVPLGFHLLLQLLLQAVYVILRLPQFCGDLQFLPCLLSQQLLLQRDDFDPQRTKN